MTIRFVEEARQEYLDAISYYEEVSTGLGRRFMEEADRSIRWIADKSELYRIRAIGYQRINLRVFPYYIPFVVRGDTLWIIAVAQSARRPHYWIERRIS